MPYDPKTGKYTPEDESVSKRLTGLLAQDNPYMQQAATRGRQAANRRGLLNSTMGVQATEAARISAALPIASQEAGQVHQTNLQGRDIASRERMQGRDIEATRERLQMELGSRQALQAAEIAAEKEMLGQQLSQQERLALADLRAAEERLGMELASREQMQQRDIESQERMQQVDVATRERIAQLDVEAQERITNLRVSADERDSASDLAASFELGYATMVTNIMNNPEIPAQARQQYLDHAATMRDNNLALVEQLYGFELEWS